MPKRIPKPSRQELKALLDDYTIIKVASRFNVCTSTVQYWMKSYGIKTRGFKGSKNPHSKLTEDQVKTIRLEFMRGITGVELAERYGISSSCVSRIVIRDTWPHVR